EHDPTDPLLRLGDAVRIDGDDLVHERDEKGEGADGPDEPLREQDPVVDERLQLSHGGRPPRTRVWSSVAPPAGPGARPGLGQVTRACVSVSSETRQR